MVDGGTEAGPPGGRETDSGISAGQLSSKGALWAGRTKSRTVAWKQRLSGGHVLGRHRGPGWKSGGGGR